MRWCRSQEDALASVQRWLQRREKPWYYLAGYAGTGKTTLARHLAEGAGRVLFAAFTGKAALCMQRSGCVGAQTIHSLIYQPTGRAKAHLRALEEKRAQAGADPEATPESLAELDAQIAEERERCRRPAFTLNPASELGEADLLVVDECSMVGARMAQDLLSFNVPILVLGDPAQLPPVGSAGFFTARAPDYTLTEIHRQSKDNPIIDLATRVRCGESIDYGQYGESSVVPVRDFDRRAVDPLAQQVLVGRNETRRRANLFLRGDRTGAVAVGEKLVCLRNDHKVGLLNGGIWHVEALADAPGAPFLTLDVSDDDDRERVLTDLEAHREPFEGQKVSPWLAMDAQEFDYGYALTVHKAQGSQWPDVVVIDESAVFRNDRRRWLYTAITRAAEKVQIVR